MGDYQHDTVNTYKKSTLKNGGIFYENNQNRNFNSNFKPGGKDARSRQGNGNPGKNHQRRRNNPQKSDSTNQRQVKLSLGTRKGEMVHHQRMLSQDVNAQATQHIVGIPVNKSRYNGYDGRQITASELHKCRPHEGAVKIIPIGGVGEFGIGKNMTLIEYKDELILIDMGVLFAGDDYPGINYMIPDIKYLEMNRDKVKAILFSHAHLDHIGACRHLLPKFNTLTPIYATEFTIGMIKKQMSELSNPPDMNYKAVDPFKHEKIQVSQHLSVEFVHVSHSIPGSTQIIIRTPNGTILFMGRLSNPKTEN